MQLRLLSALLISCCILTTQSCTPTPTDARADAKIVSKDDTRVPVVVEDVPVVVPVNPFTPPPPAGGGGGGSQGAIRPERTGNTDSGFGGAHCGNNIQEAFGRAPGCPYDIYGTSFNPDLQAAYLLGFNLKDNGQVGSTQQITSADGRCTDFRRITALDFSPDGVLYGSGRATCDDDPNIYLFTIDCQTAQATPIITISDAQADAKESELAVPLLRDLDFDPQGRLYGHSLAGRLFSINIATGNSTAIGDLGLLNPIGGLATLSFPNPESLFHINEDLSRVDTFTGDATFYSDVIFPAGTDPRLVSMDADYKTGTIYVNLFINGLSYLATFDRNTSTVSFLSATPIPVPNDFMGLATNRVYETCDGPSGLPVGTICSRSCDLIETDCGDYFLTPDDGEISPFPLPLDNNFDGLANCADPSCLNQECSSLDSCSINEVCTAQNTFPVFDSCEIDADCGPLGDCTDGGVCFCSDDDSQCPAGSVCRQGNCAQIQQIPCQTNLDCPGRATSCENSICVRPTQCIGDDRGQLPIAEGGCVDGNECTFDDCLNDKSQLTDRYTCEYSLDIDRASPGGCTPTGNCAVPLNPNGTCPQNSVTDLCLMGSCIQPGFVTCTDSAQCGGVQPGTCDAGNCTCISNLQCPAGSICDSGRCQYTPSCEAIDREEVMVIDGGCNDSNQCTVDICDQEVDELGVASYTCEFGEIDAPTPCQVGGNECVYGHCEEGECVDVANNVPTLCLTNADCGPSLLCVAGNCACDDGNDCVNEEVCNGEGICAGGVPAAPATPCQSSDNPTSCFACNDTGNCVVNGGGFDSDAFCGTASDCLIPQCTESGCNNIIISGTVTCTIGIDQDCLQGERECINGVEGSCVALNPPVPCNIP